MLTIRPADDLDLVRALWTEYWRELGLPLDFQGFQDELRGLPGKYSPPRGLLLAAEVEQNYAGTIALRPLSADAGEIKRLYVTPAYRGQGLGKQLLEVILERARELGYQTIFGDTLPSMTGPLALYQAFGFRLREGPYSEDPTPGAVYIELTL